MFSLIFNKVIFRLTTIKLIILYEYYLCKNILIILKLVFNKLIESFY